MVQVTILIDDKRLHFESKLDDLYQISVMYHFIDFADRITEISITKDYIIVTTEDRDFRTGATHVPVEKDDRRINNIDAYDWEGNHLWNIGDIVGDIKMSFFGGQVVTAKQLCAYNVLENMDEVPSVLYSCVAGGFLFIIDPIQKRLIKKISGMR